MYPFTQRVVLVGLAVAAITVLSACQSEGSHAQPAPTPLTTTDQPTEASTVPPTPVSDPPVADAPVNGTQISHPQETATPTGDKEKPSAKPRPEIEAYDSQRPMLMGLSIADKRETAIDNFGEPDSEFVMDDPNDPITVMDYTDFTVGINHAGSIEFISIESQDIDPGLNGLKLGQKASDAIDALGEPDTNTNYVIAYSNEATVLKLDIDPKTAKIQSIKLFNEVQMQ
ncbi:hypothetical protein [Paenibacillus sp. J2TS4]|uniref:hypothetical protein n=1 Tax=Paenibacillus sp. J2TS4 TaxID=2807194 RepID=UPI001AFF8BBD|nr:hypothetical protein [Paenibacillus sp. J2TS4]GIP33960.1 hypothetical protein J2TS4_31700 [Paenibacillus sp. J2TS4]